MDGTSNHPGPRTGRAALARACALALATALLGACGTQGSGTDTAQPGADLGYGAPAPDPAATTQSRTEEATTGPAAEETTDDMTEEIVIVIEGFDYALPDSVPAGAEILVRNLDSVGHTVTADEGDTFDVVVGPGEEVTFPAPSEAGEHPFHCTPHPAMTGTLVVEGEG